MRERLTAWHATVLAGLLILFVAAFAVGFSRSPRRSLQLPPRQPAPAAVQPVPGAVQQVTSSTLTIATPNGPATFTLSAGTQVESLRPAEIASFQPGDLVNTGAVRHDQTIYAITGVVDIPASLAAKAP